MWTVTSWILWIAIWCKVALFFAEVPAIYITLQSCFWIFCFISAQVAADIFDARQNCKVRLVFVEATAIYMMPHRKAYDNSFFYFLRQQFDIKPQSCCRNILVFSARAAAAIYDTNHTPKMLSSSSNGSICRVHNANTYNCNHCTSSSNGLIWCGQWPKTDLHSQNCTIDIVNFTEHNPHIAPKLFALIQVQKKSQQ